jgi:hypothetical protein
VEAAAAANTTKHASSERELTSSERELADARQEREKIRDEDLLGGWTYGNNKGQVAAGPRHVASAPDFHLHRDLITGDDHEIIGGLEQSMGRIDPFAEFMSQSNSSGGGMGTAAPNYSRRNFSPSPEQKRQQQPTSRGARLTEDTFNDLLSSQGFAAETSARGRNKTLADLKREELAKEMDPVTLKVAEWVKGKERNIRALLSSLHEVLWEEIEGNWTVPAMSDLLSNNQVRSGGEVLIRVRV